MTTPQNTTTSADPKPVSEWKQTGTCKCGHPLMEKKCADGEALESLPHHVCPLTGEEEANELIEAMFDDDWFDDPLLHAKYCCRTCIKEKLQKHLSSQTAKNKELTDKLKTAEEALQRIKTDDDPSNSGYSNEIAGEALASIRSSPSES